MYFRCSPPPSAVLCIRDSQLKSIELPSNFRSISIAGATSSTFWRHPYSVELHRYSHINLHIGSDDILTKAGAVRSNPHVVSSQIICNSSNHTPILQLAFISAPSLHLYQATTSCTCQTKLYLMETMPQDIFNVSSHRTTLSYVIKSCGYHDKSQPLLSSAVRWTAPEC